MKNIILIIVAFIMSFNVQAQNKEGSFQLGIGGLPIIYPDNSAPIGYSLKANIGYMPTNNIAIGIMPFAGKVSEISSIGASIYSRYYLVNKRFSFFIDASIGFGNLKYENAPQYNGIMNVINIGPGVHYAINKTFAFEFLLQYSRLRNISYLENTLTGNTLMPSVGVQYFIRK